MGLPHLPTICLLTRPFSFHQRTIMIACHIKQMSKEVSPCFTADDVAKIRNFSRTRSKVSHLGCLLTRGGVILTKCETKPFKSSSFVGCLRSARTFLGSQYPRPRVHQEGHPLHAAGRRGEGPRERLANQRRHQHPAHRYEDIVLALIYTAPMKPVCSKHNGQCGRYK